MDFGRPEEPEFEEVFQDFWADIVCPDGVWDWEQVKRELADYRFLLKEVPKVYIEVSNGRISKPNTYAFEVIRVFEDHFHGEGECGDYITEDYYGYDDSLDGEEEDE